MAMIHRGWDCFWVILTLHSVLLLSGCNSPQGPGPSATAVAARKTVYVDNYPLKYFAQRIAGDAVDVVLPCPAGEDPAYWRPSDAAIQGYQSADLILLNGATFAKWVAYVSLPESRLVDTSQGFADDFIQLEDAVLHSHGPGGEHAHGGAAFTTWLDPRQAIRQAEAVSLALTRLLPNEKPRFDEGFAKLQHDIQQLDRALTDAMQGYSKQPLLASHPVYHYLARRCSWNLKSLHWEPDEIPSAEQWEELAKVLETHPAKWMIWEASPQAEVVEKLKGLGVGCTVFEPCGNVPEQRDYMSVMQKNVENLKAMVGRL